MKKDEKIITVRIPHRKIHFKYRVLMYKGTKRAILLISSLIQ